MWKRFLRVFAITALAGLALSLALILLVDPLGISPIGIVRDAGDGSLALSDRRFAAPRIIRSKNFDSFLLGTSTMHSVDPQWAEDAFGGSFANLTLFGGTPFEMTEIMRLIGHQLPGLRRLILGIDINRWCELQGYQQFNKKVAFPDWLYDESRLNDFSALYNLNMLEAAFDQLRVQLGLKKRELPANGYRNQLKEAKWSAAEAKEKIYGSDGIAAVDLDPDDTEDHAGSVNPAGNFPDHTLLNFPDHALLRQAAAALPPTAELILVIMPSHASDFVNGDALRQLKTERCKRSITKQISLPRVTVIDFHIASIWTRNDDYYWDRHHIRLGLAHDLLFRVKEATERRRDAEDGVYRYLAGPGFSATTSR